MELKDQVTNRELSERLRDLGVPQESLFWWVEYTDGFGSQGERWDVQGNHIGYKQFCAAFTVAELGEMLPHTFKTGNEVRLLECAPDYPGGWWVRDGSYSSATHAEWADTEADARAAMLVYLLENHLITL